MANDSNIIVDDLIDIDVRDIIHKPDREMIIQNLKDNESYLFFNCKIAEQPN